MSLPQSGYKPTMTLAAYIQKARKMPMNKKDGAYGYSSTQVFVSKEHRGVLHGSARGRAMRFRGDHELVFRSGAGMDSAAERGNHARNNRNKPGRIVCPD